MKTHVSRPNPNVESANMHVVSPVCGNAYHDSEEPQGLPPALPSLPPNPGPCLLTPLSHACSPHTTSQIRHNPPPPHVTQTLITHLFALLTIVFSFWVLPHEFSLI